MTIPPQYVKDEIKYVTHSVNKSNQRIAIMQTQINKLEHNIKNQHRQQKQNQQRLKELKKIVTEHYDGNVAKEYLKWIREANQQIPREGT